MPAGYLALILHAHLPFVRHPEQPDFLEEDWLFEAITETHLPLLASLERLVRQGAAVRLAVSLSPTLCAMLGDPLLQERYVRHLERLLALAGKEVVRTRREPAFQELALFYRDRLTAARRQFCDGYRCDLVGAWRRLAEAGHAELFTCAATHGLLPLLQEHPPSVRAQVLVARDEFRRWFGCEPRGIWLPECGYFPGLDQVLQEAEFRWFILDTHGLMFGTPPPRYGVCAPVYTPAGIAAFGRDVAAARQVWSAREGYPGHPVYRDFYRDLGFDREADYLRPHLHAGGHRHFTGLKYYRVTGPGDAKEPYRRPVAVRQAARDATDFLERRRRQARRLAGIIKRRPLLVAPYDAELFGHWWFEGPEFVAQLLERAGRPRSSLALVTPTDYLRRHPHLQVVEPAASSWGDRGYWAMWLDQSNDWIYPHLHVAGARLTELVRHHAAEHPLAARAVRQAARELLLAQASDWAFIIKTGTAVDYARRRVHDHVQRFTRLYEQIRARQIDAAWLAGVEGQDNLFPEIDLRHFL
ncbi:DUF1957 domain-containing protein [bacterium]|nr:DUF1957 domain-containing protein [bacterium]